MEKPGDLVLVIFGASGDLTSRKLLPALYSLHIQKLLPSKFAIVGCGRTSFSDTEFRNKMMEGILSYSEQKVDDREKVQEFIKCISYISMDNSNVSDFERLRLLLDERVKELDSEANFIFYMATPPSMYSVIAENLHASQLSVQDSGFRRLIIEKPFGYDLVSGKELNLKLHELVNEDQI